MDQIDYILVISHRGKTHGGYRNVRKYCYGYNKAKNYAGDFVYDPYIVWIFLTIYFLCYFFIKL
jgi:hypothetical protein